MGENVDKALKLLRETFGFDSAVLMSDVLQAKKTAIPIGITAIDVGVLGIGGFPRGQFFEFYGKEKVGKTTLLLHMMAAAQSDGLLPIVLDPKAATASDLERAMRIGVDVDNCVLLPVKTSEEGIEQLQEVIVNLRKESVGIAIFWDDMGLTATRGNVETFSEKRRRRITRKEQTKIGEKSKVMWSFCRTLSGLCYREGIPLVIVNHLIANIQTGGFRGSTSTTIGGGATRAASRIRLKLQKVETIKRGKIVIGQLVKVICEANAFAVPGKSALVYLSYEDGYDNTLSTIHSALDEGLVSKSRGRYRDKLWPRGSKAKALCDWTEREIVVLEDRMWSDVYANDDTIIVRSCSDDEDDVVCDLSDSGIDYLED